MSTKRVVNQSARRNMLVILSSVILLGLNPAGSLGQGTTVDDQTCLSCHEDYDRTLQSTTHRLTEELSSAAVDVSCTSCHTGAGVHIEDPSAENISNPATSTQLHVDTLCSGCHVAHLELDNIGFDPHLNQGLSCVSCHSVHGENQGLLQDARGEFCGRCHIGLGAQWNRTSIHPLADEQVSCLSCHDFTGRQEPAFGHGPAENCYTCHPEVSGPFFWEHEATSSFTPDGGGCVACHNPHGSPNDRLLTEPGDALCTQCHGIPPLHRASHDGFGTQFQCIECHSEVHGSDHSSALLDPNLGSKIGDTPVSCSCHGVDG